VLFTSSFFCSCLPSFPSLNFLSPIIPKQRWLVAAFSESPQSLTKQAQFDGSKPWITRSKKSRSRRRSLFTSESLQPVAQCTRNLDVEVPVNILAGCSLHLSSISTSARNPHTGPFTSDYLHTTRHTSVPSSMQMTRKRRRNHAEANHTASRKRMTTRSSS
jgi:hypothetical protein